MVEACCRYALDYKQLFFKLSHICIAIGYNPFATDHHPKHLHTTKRLNVPD